MRALLSLTGRRVRRLLERGFDSPWNAAIVEELLGDLFFVLGDHACVESWASAEAAYEDDRVRNASGPAAEVTDQYFHLVRDVFRYLFVETELIPAMDDEDFVGRVVGKRRLVETRGFSEGAPRRAWPRWNPPMQPGFLVHRSHEQRRLWRNWQLFVSQWDPELCVPAEALHDIVSACPSPSIRGRALEIAWYADGMRSEELAAKAVEAYAEAGDGEEAALFGELVAMSAY